VRVAVVWGWWGTGGGALEASGGAWWGAAADADGVGGQGRAYAEAEKGLVRERRTWGDPQP
jgi:hypothetical protein